MFGPVRRSVVGGLVGAASLGVLLCGVPAAASSGQAVDPGPVVTRPKDGEHPGKAAKEKPDPAWKEAYERVHEPREKSEQAEAAREKRTAGK
jgi:hypothetical protein